jgi:hypothetical protein
MPDMVPRPQVPAASALGSISINLARAIGPAIAGLLVARIGVVAVFGLNTATFVFYAVVLAFHPRLGKSTSGSTGTGKPAPTCSTATMPRHCPTLSRKPATT